MIRRRPAAVQAIIDQAEFIGLDSPAAAERFISSVEATLVDLHAMPLIGRAYEPIQSHLAGLRLCLVKGFPNHIVFYRPTSYGIEVVLVVHAARDLLAALMNESD